MKRENRYLNYLLRNRKLVAILAVVLAAGIIGFVLWLPKTEAPQLTTLSELAADINAGQVTKIEDTIYGEFTIHYQDGETTKGLRDTSTSLLQQLDLLGVGKAQLAQVQFGMADKAYNSQANPLSVLFGFGLIGTLMFAVTRVTRDSRVSKKKFEQVEIPSLRFQDVAGLDDHLQELREIVGFLKNGSRFAEMGARMPRGVLMVGDPGTGKTLIAKAVAGEAGVPFFATSGSEFTEVFVGVGASRVRALFEKARKHAPCIIFIDEIDAVGRMRHRSESGAEMEQDQTLNQLLVEMDGFSPSEEVVVLAATNRVDVLDPALLRPGRFDRRVYINRPDLKGRKAILDIHARGKKIAPAVDLVRVAQATPGLVGADLANIVNEAAIVAVRNNHTAIEQSDFEEAVEKLLAGGVQRKSHVMSPDERRIVAYHEAGHAVVMHATEQADPVIKISIIPRGQAGGYTMAVPEEDRMLISRCKILARITGLLGGRAAEEIFFSDVTSGASNDLHQATQLAEEMVMRLGMDSRAGLRVIKGTSSAIPAMGTTGSQKTFETIDEAVNSILEECYREARRILLEKRDQVGLIADELLRVETMDRSRFVEIMDGELTPV